MENKHLGSFCADMMNEHNKQQNKMKMVICIIWMYE